MIIRRAETSDASMIAALGTTVWIDTYARESVTTAFADYVLAEFTKDSITTQLSSPSNCYWVAEDQEGILGFVDLALDRVTAGSGETRQAEVRRLYVLERHCRKGLGSRLLRAASDYAFARGYEAVWLSVWAGNERALKFYPAAGWKLTGDTSFVLDGQTYPNKIFTLVNHGIRPAKSREPDKLR